MRLCGSVGRLAALVLTALMSACGMLTVPRCPAGQEAQVVDSLYFGTTRPGGAVTADDWARFIADEATPRFPAGLTAWPASGQWRGSDGHIEREAAYVLTLVHADSPATEAAVAALMQRYKAMFRQEAVLRTRTGTCVSF